MDVHAGILHTVRAQADRLGICRRWRCALELAAVWTERTTRGRRLSGTTPGGAH
jgi:hypothetical protein